MSNSVCMLHTDRSATANCAECSRPLCQECTQIVASKPICQSCVTAIRSRVATQLNAEAASTRTAQPLPPEAPNAPYGAPPSGPYPPVGPQPAAPSSGAPRTDLAGNMYNPPPGSQYAAPPPYGAPQNPTSPPPTPGYSPQAPYGAQPGYGAPSSPPYGQQPGYGQPQQQPAASGQPGYSPYGAAQQPYPPQQQQTGYPNAQAPYGTQHQPYPGQNPYGVQPSRPLSPPQAGTTAGNYILGVIFGLLTAVVGAALYAWVIYATGVSIGYMALGVGFIIGWAVKMGTRMPSQAAGIIAAALTALAILPVRFHLYYSTTNILYHSPTNIVFTLLFLFIGCRWAYTIASTGHLKSF